MLNWIVWNRTDYMHKMDLAFNNLQRLICHKTQPTNICCQFKLCIISERQEFYNECWIYAFLRALAIVFLWTHKNELYIILTVQFQQSFSHQNKQLYVLWLDECVMDSRFRRCWVRVFFKWLFVCLFCDGSWNSRSYFCLQRSMQFSDCFLSARYFACDIKHYRTPTQKI